MNMRGSIRREFPQSVRKLAFRRCCGNDGTPRCETCGGILRPGGIVYEHDQPDGLQGDPTIENCKVHCKVCADAKTHTEDNPRMRKADAVLKSTYGLQAKKQPIRSQGFIRRKPQLSASRPIVRRTYT